MSSNKSLLRLSCYCIFLLVALSTNSLGRTNLIGESVYFYEEGKEKKLTIADIISRDSLFVKNNKQIVNLGLSDSYYWLKFSYNSVFPDLYLHIDQAKIEYIELYIPDSNNRYSKPIITGVNYPFSSKPIATQTFVYEIPQKEGKVYTYYVRLKGNIPLTLPIIIDREETIQDGIRRNNIVFGIYAGVIICMTLYNLFLLFSIKEDRSYLWYVLHTIFVGLTQASFLGYTVQFLWPNSLLLANIGPFIFTCLVSIFGIIFLQQFLDTKRNIHRLNKVFYGFYIVYGIIILLTFQSRYVLAYTILQPTQGLVALFILFVSIYLVRKGYKQARFYLLSWFSLLIAIILFALKDTGTIPYSFFTSTIMLSGSALQVVLLSFALGDKINIYKDERNASQRQALQTSQENERIIREQNIILEQSVQERTKELQQTNDNLEKTLVELKEAEMQLVESEKMASLGQLTAGIAHEINNPINFVTSNVKPLKRDITLLQEIITQMEDISVLEISADEKRKRINEIKEQADFDYTVTEIDYLLKGISEGASRTSEIVKGLRVFSRLDEDDIKLADINEGLDSTIVIVNNLLNGKIAVEKNYQELPLVECYPGKLNQVFLNMMSNGIHAIHERWKEEMGGKLTISTYENEHDVTISIKDNGIGMSEETKKKLFEPFFTTKDVGVGTGLGLSIAWNTIKKHNGLIQVNSEIGVGTEFVMTIPIKYSEPQND